MVTMIKFYNRAGETEIRPVDLGDHQFSAYSRMNEDVGDYEVVVHTGAGEPIVVPASNYCRGILIEELCDAHDREKRLVDLTEHQHGQTSIRDRYAADEDDEGGTDAD